LAALPCGPFQSRAVGVIHPASLAWFPKSPLKVLHALSRVIGVYQPASLA
jgi:hypothetical protein